MVDYLISDVREDTENEEFSDTVGIKDERVIDYLNEAQSRLQSQITKQHPNVFVSEELVPIVANQETYPVPRNTMAKNRISLVEYQSENDEAKWYPLRASSLRNRAGGCKGHPSHYIRRTGELLIYPVPDSSSGNLRVSYVKEVPRLDKRRASVASATIVSNEITSLFLDVSTDIIDEELTKYQYLCIVDSLGNIKSQGIPYTQIDTVTGEVFVSSGFLLQDGETIDAGDYVTCGKYATTHSELDDYVERYLIAYANYKMLKRDSSVDYADAAQELAQMEQEIIEFYAEIDDDIFYIEDLQAANASNWEW